MDTGKRLPWRSRPLVWAALAAAVLACLTPVPKGCLDGVFEEELGCQAVGYVESFQETEQGVKITLRPAAAIWKDRQMPLRKLILYADVLSLQLGDALKADGVLKKFQKPGNPGEFNAFEYYKRNGYDYAFYAEQVEKRGCRQGIKEKIMTKLFAFRTLLDSSFNELYPSKEQAGLLREMFLGEKGEAPEDIKMQYQRLGIGHLLCVSGMHISLIGMGLYQITLRLTRYKKLSCCLGMAGSVVYGLMTGFGVSAQRAVLMLCISFFAILVGRAYDMLSAACLSMVLLLAVRPYDIKSCGFLLSFGAVLGIAALYPMWRGWLANWERPKMGFLQRLLLYVADMMGLSVSIQLVTFPILLHFYFEYPAYSLILNLFVLPLMSLLAGVSMLSAIMGLLWKPAGIFLAGGASAILMLYERLCGWFDQLPGSRLILGRPQEAYLLWYYGILILTMCFFYWKQKASVLLLAGMIALVPIQPRRRGLQITVLDVGQGDGIFLETEDGFCAMIDGGSSSRKSLGKYVLGPFLRSRGIDRLDAVFLSHLDEDHYNGILELLEEPDFGIQICHLYITDAELEDEAFLPWRRLLQKAGVPASVFSAGDVLRERKGKLAIRCHYPIPGKKWEDRNEVSMVCSVLYEDFSMLFTGDIGAAEKEACVHLPVKGYTVLKVGHHGSKNSTSEDFLQRVVPRISVVSAGRNNRYGHPHPDTLQRLEQYRSQIYRTDLCGAIELRYERRRLSLRCFRE